MSDVFTMMRKGRLEYALKREIDRQNVHIDEDAIAALVEAAAAKIDAYYIDTDARGVAAEKAEKTINPLVAALAEANERHVTRAACLDFLDSPDVVVFPWTSNTP